MRIAKIWHNDYPWDIRVEKISRTLIADGHDVHLICRNLKKLKTEDVIDGINIHRLHPLKGRLNNIFSSVAFFNPVWIQRIYEIVKREKLQILLVRDLPLAISAIIIGKLFSLPVIFDMAENYPAMWREHVDRRGFKSINYILKNPLIATFMENYVLKNVNHTIVVVEESKQRLIKKGVSQTKISVVSNTPDLNFFPKNPSPPPPPNDYRIIMLYVGYVNGGRGLDTVIKAIPQLKQKQIDVQLIIAGDGEYLKDLKEIAQKKQISQHISFLGWVDFKIVPKLISKADICIVPHDATDFVNSTIPNKLFDYMACQKPVIVSDATPLSRIVRETNCGVVFKSKNPQDFAAKFMHLTDPCVRRQKGDNGANAVQLKYNWAHDSLILKDIFKNFQNKSKSN